MFYTAALDPAHLQELPALLKTLPSCAEALGGAINAATVPPRHVLQRCLEINSAAVTLAHNHPSGEVLPSEADRTLTRTLKQLLSQVDVQVLDHVIVGSGEAYSFAENGNL